VIPSGSNLQLH